MPSRRHRSVIERPENRFFEPDDSDMFEAETRAFRFAKSANLRSIAIDP